VGAEPVCIGFIGPSGAGKSTVIERIVPLLRAGGLRVGVLKHSHHPFERPGSDSDRFCRSEADGVAVLAPDGLWMPRPASDPCPRALAGRIFAGFDLVLVEGFRGAGLPAFHVARPGTPPDPRPAPGPHLGTIAGRELAGALPIDAPAVIAAAVRAAAAQLRATG